MGFAYLEKSRGTSSGVYSRGLCLSQANECRMPWTNPEPSSGHYILETFDCSCVPRRWYGEDELNPSHVPLAGNLGLQL